MPLSRKICCGGDWQGWAEVRGRQGQELFLGFVLSLMGNRHQNTSWTCSFTSIRLRSALQHPLRRLYPSSMNEDPLKKPQAFSQYSSLHLNSSGLHGGGAGGACMCLWVSDHSFRLPWAERQLGMLQRKREFFMTMTFTLCWNVIKELHILL